MNSDNPILERIKKLLRLASNDGATAPEAATALRKAMEIAAAHGIDFSAVKFSEDNAAGLTHLSEKSQAGTAHTYASSLVENHFGVETIFDSRKLPKVIHFIGLPINCQLAKYAYIYLVRAMETAWRKRPNRRLRNRDAFIHGFATAIHRLMPRAFKNEGLILSAKAYTESVLADRFTRFTQIKAKSSKSTRSDSAFFHGYAAGKEAGIRNPIHGSTNLYLPGFES